MKQIDDLARARRLARTIASDISLFHESLIMEGLQQDDFFERLSAELDKGRSHYQSRLSPSLSEAEAFFDEAIVDIIIFPRGHLPISIWAA